MEGPRQDHLSPADPAELARGVLAASVGPEETILVAVGQFRPGTAESVRVHLVAASPQGVRALSDRWVRDSHVALLSKTLGASHRVRTGESDAMYATGWSRAWTTDPGPFALWDRNGLVLWQDGSRLFRGERGAPRDSWDRARIDGVHAFVSDTWVERGVRIVLEGGTEVELAREEDLAVYADPTYDLWNLSFEAKWARSLAKALATALAVRLEVDEPLR